MLDTDKQGFELVFRIPWRAAIMEHLITSDEEMNSGKAHEFIVSNGFKKSRASVIFFLQDMKEEGWLSSYPRSGKGGMHDVYRRVVDVEEFWRRVTNIVSTSLIAESGIADLYYSLQEKVN